MVGTILIVLTEGFDDMAYLSNQVILEEAGNDVITTSPEGGAVKGSSSSAMSVEVEEAINQDLNYSAVILIGDKSLVSIDGIKSILNEFHQKNKPIGIIGPVTEAITELGIDEEISNNQEIVKSNSMLSMRNPENSEEFAETMASMI